MQRFAGKAGVGALLLVTGAVAFLAGSAIDDGNAAVIRGQQITRGIEWPNFSTGVDYNARERDAAGGHKEYFAEIHLLIQLGNESTKRKVDQAAEDNNLSRLHGLLVECIDSTWPGYHADTAIIRALTLRQ